MDKLVFACTALLGTTKVGKLTPDENGYYDLILGALEFDNSYGAQYSLRSAQELFKASSSLVRRMNNGYCKSECGHPKREPGMTDDDFLYRIMRIEETRVCAHIKKVWIDFDSVKHKGRPVIAIRGLVKPSGPLGPSLKESLENPDENVAFSIRSITDDEIYRGKHIKHFREIITWDFVTEPGLSIANKFQHPSLEDLEQMAIPVQVLADKMSRQSMTGLGIESSNILKSVVDTVKHQRTLGATTATPLYMKW